MIIGDAIQIGVNQQQEIDPIKKITDNLESLEKFNL